MNNFEFCNPVKIVFGKGSMARLSELVPEGSKVLMIYGGGSIKRNGIYEQVVKALHPFDLFEFGGIEANPHYETCMKAVEIVKKEKIDFLLAVGGGSVIDATKFVAAATCFEEGDPWTILSKGAAVKKALPLGVVLTLSATGSEMNERAVISRAEIHQKLNFASPLVFPKFSILDPEVTYSLPPRQVANGVVDSFIHVVEQYLTYPVNGMVQDEFSEGLMRVIHTEGLKVLEDPHNYDIRANLMWAATNALNVWIGQGVPQDWSSHRMGYSLTALFGLDHAQTLAILLPGVMTYMFKEKQQKLAQMGKAVFGIVDGTEEERAHKSIEACEDFFRKMGLKTRLGECGIHKEDIPALAEPIDRQGWKLGEHHNIDSKVASDIMALRL